MDDREIRVMYAEAELISSKAFRFAEKGLRLLSKSRRMLYAAAAIHIRLMREHPDAVHRFLQSAGGIDAWLRSHLGSVADLVGDDVYELCAGINRGMTREQFLSAGSTVFLVGKGSTRTKGRSRDASFSASAPVPDRLPDNTPVEDRYHRERERAMCLEVEVKRLRRVVVELSRSNIQFQKQIKHLLAAIRRSEVDEAMTA